MATKKEALRRHISDRKQIVGQLHRFNQHIDSCDDSVSNILINERFQSLSYYRGSLIQFSWKLSI